VCVCVCIMTGQVAGVMISASLLAVGDDALEKVNIYVYVYIYVYIYIYILYIYTYTYIHITYVHI